MCGNNNTALSIINIIAVASLIIEDLTFIAASLLFSSKSTERGEKVLRLKSWLAALDLQMPIAMLLIENIIH